MRGVLYPFLRKKWGRGGEKLTVRWIWEKNSQPLSNQFSTKRCCLSLAIFASRRKTRIFGTCGENRVRENGRVNQILILRPRSCNDDADADAEPGLSSFASEFQIFFFFSGVELTEMKCYRSDSREAAFRWKIRSGKMSSIGIFNFRLVVIVRDALLSPLAAFLSSNVSMEPSLIAFVRHH